MNKKFAGQFGAMMGAEIKKPDNASDVEIASLIAAACGQLPVADERRQQAFNEALLKTNQKFGRALKKLAD